VGFFIIFTPGLNFQLADSMIRMSVIVTNRSTDPLCKTTLIIAPLALLDQWKMEIETKTNCKLKCLIYHGKHFGLLACSAFNL
jgi:SNF2-related domain